MPHTLASALSLSWPHLSGGSIPNSRATQALLQLPSGAVTNPIVIRSRQATHAALIGCCPLSLTGVTFDAPSFTPVHSLAKECCCACHCCAAPLDSATAFARFMDKKEADKAIARPAPS
jgi:hypothetical protein